MPQNLSATSPYFNAIFQVFGKSHRAVVILLVVLSTAALVVPEDAFAISGPPPPSVLLEFERGWTAAPKCSAEYTVKLWPMDGFQGAVNLTLVDPPKGVTVDIYPNPAMLSFWNRDGIVFPMTVIVSPDTPNGTYKVKVAAIALPGPGSILFNENYNNKTATRFYGYFTLAVGKCGEPLPDATTTTTKSTTISSITTSTTTTTVTETITRLSTQPVTDYSTTVWTIGATAATPRRVVYDNHTVPEGQYLVLFAVGVMNSEGNRVQYVSDKIPFVVGNATISTSTTVTTVTKQASDSPTYAWAVSATAAAVVLAVALLLQRRRT
jgi:hypothetical protein